jgi:polysaccharide biosynthesis/export protein
MTEYMGKIFGARRRKMMPHCAALLLAFSLTGCTHSLVAEGLGGPTVTRAEMNELPGPDGQMGAGQGYDFQIGPFDKLIIDVLGIKELTERRVTVDGSGNIVLPIAGVIHVRDLSLGEASGEITRLLKKGYVKAPQVSVNLDESVSDFVTVDGEVKQPGNYPILSGMTLMRAVAGAKGASEYAKLREVVIHREVKGQQMIALYDLEAIRRGAYPDPVLYPHDVIVVGDSPGRRLLQTIIGISPLLISPLVAVLNNRN